MFTHDNVMVGEKSIDAQSRTTVVVSGVSRVNRDSAVTFDAEINEDPMPLLFVGVLVDEAGGMPFAQDSELLEEVRFVWCVFRVGNDRRSRMASLPLCCLAFLAGPLPSPLRHAFAAARHLRRL